MRYLRELRPHLLPQNLPECIQLFGIEVIVASMVRSGLSWIVIRLNGLIVFLFFLIVDSWSVLGFLLFEFHKIVSR